MSALRYLTIPEDQQLLAAIGRVAVAHAQLDYVLRLTIQVMESRSLDNVMRDDKLRGSKKMRNRILKQAEKCLGDNEATRKLKTLLDKAEKVSDRRSEYIHNVFGSDDQAKFWTHAESGKPFDIPSVAQLNALTEKIQLIVKELNTARRKGWLLEALDKKSRKRKKDKKAKGKKAKNNSDKEAQPSDVKTDSPIKSEDQKPKGKKALKVKKNSKDDSADESVTTVVSADVAQSTPPITNGAGGELPLTEVVMKQGLVEDASRKSDDKDT